MNINEAISYLKNKYGEDWNTNLIEITDPTDFKIRMLISQYHFGYKAKKALNEIIINNDFTIESIREDIKRVVPEIIKMNSDVIKNN